MNSKPEGGRERKWGRGLRIGYWNEATGMTLLE